MGGERTRRGNPRVRAVALAAGQWSSGPLLVARTGVARRRGLRPVMGPCGAVFTGRSLIGWGMAETVRWFGLTTEGTVIASGVLRPGRLAVAPRRARLMVETPVWVPAPAVGARLAAVPILAAWPDD